MRSSKTYQILYRIKVMEDIVPELRVDRAFNCLCKVVAISVRNYFYARKIQ